MESCVVVTIGDVNESQPSPEGSPEKPALVFAPNPATYSRVFIHEQRVVGAILVGDSALDFSVFVDAVERQLPWSDTITARFMKTGQLPHSGSTPADTVICFCTGTTHGKLAELRDAHHSHESITALTGASLHCGSCAQRVATITAGKCATSRKLPQPKGLWTATTLSLLLLAAVSAAVVVPFSQSWQSHWRTIDVLWRSVVAKQISGYTLLALMLISFVPALLRRVQRKSKRPQALSLMSWHLIAACALIAGVVVHTGARMGYGLNAMLNGVLLATLVLGSVMSVAWRKASHSSRHRTVAENIRIAHWMLLFPLPAIIAFHVLKVYYF